MSRSKITTEVSAGGSGKVPVWDILVRLLHLFLIVSVVVSWFTRHAPGPQHEWWGYTALAVVLARILRGFGHSMYARFSQFLRSPGHTWNYFLDLMRGRQARYLGHNPLGGWMSVLLLLNVLAVCVSGWLFTTDRFWGVEWVDVLHSRLTDVLMILVVLHLLGVVASSVHGRENLPAAMVHGKKRAASEDDIA